MALERSYQSGMVAALPGNGRWPWFSQAMVLLITAFAAWTASSLPQARAAPPSPLFTGIARLADDSIQLAMTGTLGSVYLLQSSSNGQGWGPTATLSNAEGGFRFTDSSASSSSKKFYRLQTAPPTNSVYWTLARQTHGFVATNLLTPQNSYRNKPGSGEVYEWYSASQIYADAAMAAGGDARYVTNMNNAYAWMNNVWDGANPAGGYFAAANIDGTGKGGGKYVDDNSLTGNAYLDCYAASVGPARTNYLDSAKAIANWLMVSGMWDGTYGGGFWWSDSKTVKPTQSNGLALQLFIRLYALTKQTRYRDWANSVKNWLETEMYDSSDGLYLWQVETNGAKNRIKFTYDNAIMIEANLLYAQLMGDPSYLSKAQSLANKLNAKLWNSTHKAYYFNTADGRVNPCWCGWASQSLLKLYEADGNAAWLNHAQQNIDFMNAHLRNAPNGAYSTFCNMDGSSVENRLEGVDQAWMQRLQALLSSYR